MGLNVACTCKKKNLHKTCRNPVLTSLTQLMLEWEMNVQLNPLFQSRRKYFKMSSLTSDTLTLGNHLIIGLPSGPTRNFSKFHLMSLTLRGSQNNLLVGLPKLSPTGGQAFFKIVKRACSLTPFTSTFSNNWKFGTNPLPGRTYFNAERISIFFPGSCMPNWLQGNPRILNPTSRNSCCSAFNSRYWKVSPQ